MIDGIPGPSRRRLLAVVAAAAMPLPALAQAPWPNRPIRYIVPFPPGGATDVISRPVLEAMREELGQPIVIENVGGAGGSLGVARLARSAPDGYTIGLGNTGAMTVNPSLSNDTGYDPLRDFTPISLLTEYENVLLVPAASPVRTLRDLVDLAKSRPQGVSYASAGIGSSNHLTSEMLRSATGVTMDHIPYRGSAQALLDLVGGRVDFMFDVPSTALPTIRGGQTRAIGTSGRVRHPLLPEVPTIGETDPGFETVGWMAVFAPKGLPDPIRDRLSAAFGRVLAKPELAARLQELGYAQRSSTPAELASRVERDLATWGGVIRAANIRAE
ncbi:Bug family tripartite tricarboxylate transporter substrate binding protein [Muricoccus radiodurans]|uniref:Bug family tripartite tricarboxylate transporter substrate binding protein n=1 Tax=Muricoccus radiodurans TaxID=2231721 RepID=UPI003CF4A971